MSVRSALTQLTPADAAGVLELGAPGVYFAPASASDPLDVAAMDVAAFLGAAPRGPAWVRTTDPQDGAERRARSVAVAVDSWDDYVDLYGGIQPDLFLGRAVSAYFAQGGRRAYIVRVVEAAGRGGPAPGPDEPPPGCARLAVSLPDAEGHPRVWLSAVAADEGTWGDELEMAVTFTLRRVGAVAPAACDDPQRSVQLLLPPSGLLPPGATVRFTPPARVVGAEGHRTTRYGEVVRVRRLERPQNPHAPVAATLQPGLALDTRTVIDVVETTVSVTDRDPTRRRQETHPRLGLHPGHPRYLGTVLAERSRLVRVLAPPDPELVGSAVEARRLVLEPVAGGQDRWARLRPEDFLPDRDLPGSGGVDALEPAQEVATIVAPDLYWPATAPAARLPELPATSAPVRFRRCDAAPTARPTDATDPGPAPGLALDPRDPADLARIVARQRDLLLAAESQRRVALIDVPPGLDDAQVQAWRAQLDTAFGAAYHPWLELPSGAGLTLPVPPSAVAAGIVARSELVHGLPHGPANAVATGVADVDAVVGSEQHAALHRSGINVFLVDSDGIRLSAGRTLASDPQWRQLSVRRLLLSIERTVRHQLQWCAFESNDDRLRDNVRTQLNALMRLLFAQGAFAGSTPEESWFVRVASAAEARAQLESGQLVAEVGVAPAEPLEFIVVRVAVQAEGEIKSSLLAGR